MSKEQFIPRVANVNSYLLSFQSGDLVSSQLIVQHNLRALYPMLVVYDESNKMVLPDEIIYLDEDRIQVDLTNLVATMTGRWHVKVIKD